MRQVSEALTGQSQPWSLHLLGRAGPQDARPGQRLSILSMPHGPGRWHPWGGGMTPPSHQWLQETVDWGTPVTACLLSLGVSTGSEEAGPS